VFECKLFHGAPSVERLEWLRSLAPVPMFGPR
jgi:hypothetical protein